MNRNADSKSMPTAEYRQVVFTVVSEGLKNFSEAKEAVLSYVSGIGDKTQLNIILNRLEEVRGVSTMLPMERVEAQIVKLQNYIRVALLNNNHKVNEEEQDTVADVVTAIEYFFEALSEGRPGVEQGLNAGDEAAAKLKEITQSYGDSVIESPEDVEAGTVAGSVTATDDGKVAKPQERAATHISRPAATQELKDIGQYAILAEDADEEIVEIFIEEAVEVLGELHTYLPQWKENTDNEEALAIVRRSFHTLKGSGRLLGADLIGEFSWKVEYILNRIIDKKIIINDSLFHLFDESLAVLPQLIEQLKGNREPVDNVAELMASAEAFADGREVTFEVVAESEKGSYGDENADVIEMDLSPEADDDNVKIIISEDISGDVVIGDSSDLDISELDPENNISVEEIEFSTVDDSENTEVELDAEDEEIVITSVSYDSDMSDDYEIEIGRAHV